MNGAPDLPEWAAWLIAGLVVVGAVITLTGAIGLARLKSFYDRVHAPTLGATRVWLHTCTLDGEAALPNYLARGFTPFRTERYVATLPD